MILNSFYIINIVKKPAANTVLITIFPVLSYFEKIAHMCMYLCGSVSLWLCIFVSLYVGMFVARANKVEGTTS